MIWLFIIGIFVGIIAKFIIPVSGHIPWYMLGVIGVIGSFLGGFIARLFSSKPSGPLLQPAGFFLSILGAVILLFVYEYSGIMR
jgi:uncharacterized membrane protein YeaQ/YmgE (transglycosylase-associated protein family)